MLSFVVSALGIDNFVGDVDDACEYIDDFEFVRIVEMKMMVMIFVVIRCRRC